MKIKEQTRKLATGCSKHCFEVVDRTDEVSNHTYGKATLVWFKEIFEEYYFWYSWMITPCTTRFTVPVGDGVSGLFSTLSEVNRAKS